jgi:ATP-dependent Lhr-like helicase
VLDVVPHRAGKLPKFDRPASEALDDRLVETMRRVFEDDDRPAYLDPAALEFLDQGRAAYRELGLGHSSMTKAGNDTHLLTWAGTAVNDLLGMLLISAGLETEVHDIGVTAIDTTPEELTALLSKLEECPPIEDLAGFVQGLREAKLDEFVDEELLRRLWALRNEDHREGVTSVLRGFVR